MRLTKYTGKVKSFSANKKAAQLKGTLKGQTFGYIFAASKTHHGYTNSISHEKSTQ